MDPSHPIRSYTASIVASLRLERDAEGKAHEETRQWAEARITELEAQVARRDAELEECLISAGNSAERRLRLDHRKVETVFGDSRRMTSEEAVKVLETASVRSRMLELEVQELASKVCILLRLNVILSYESPK